MAVKIKSDPPAWQLGLESRSQKKRCGEEVSETEEPTTEKALSPVAIHLVSEDLIMLLTDGQVSHGIRQCLRKGILTFLSLQEF